MGIIGFAVKSSLAGGITYYTIQEGLWSSPEDSIKFYEKIYNKVTPLVRDNISADILKEIPTLPNARTMASCAGGMWNTGVKTSIKFISELPTHVSNGIDSLTALATVKDSVESIKSSGESPSQPKPQ